MMMPPLPDYFGTPEEVFIAPRMAAEKDEPSSRQEDE
jgi:hypothetical protein